MRAVLDWLDNIFDGDREGLRVVLVAISIPLLLIAAEWGINKAFFSGPSELCRETPSHWLCTGERPATPTPDEIKRMADKIIREVREGQ